MSSLNKVYEPISEAVERLEAGLLIVKDIFFFSILLSREVIEQEKNVC